MGDVEVEVEVSREQASTSLFGLIGNGTEKLLHEQRGKRMQSLSSELSHELEEHRTTAATLREVLGSAQVAEIEDAIRRLESLEVAIAVFGETNAGKSALLNSLLGLSNDRPEECAFKTSEKINTWSNEAEIQNGVKWREVEGLNLTIYDTPGIAGDFKEHAAIAGKIAANSDLILYVLFEEVKGDLQVPLMREIIAQKKPLLVVINKVDIRRPSEVDAIKAGIKEKFSIGDDLIIEAAGHPRFGEPIIGALVEKILNIIRLHHYGLINDTIKARLDKGMESYEAILKARMAEVEAEAARRRQQNIDRLISLKESADSLVTVYSRVAAASAAIIPFGFDAVTSTVVSGTMFYKLAKVYGQELDASVAFKIGKELVGAFRDIVFVSAATLAGYLAITKGAKTNPITYAIGMAIDGAFTYLIVSSVGSTFSVYCSNGLTWRDEKEASRVMKEYLRKNIGSMFLDRLPKRYKERVVAKINPDLVA